MSSQNRPELEIETSLAAGTSAHGGAPLEKARNAFEALGEVLNDSILSFRHAIQDTTDPPDEVELRFELAFKGETKWVVISAGGQATAAVKLVWKKKS